MINFEKSLPIICSTLLLSSIPSTAFGYLDPGTGSMILQGIIGSIAIAMATGKIWWYKVKTLFSSDKNEELEQEDTIQESKTEN